MALIKVRGLPKSIKPVKLGSNDVVSVGDNVYAIGHPLSYPWTFSFGMVSQVRNNFKWKYDQKYEHKADVVQMQTPISTGNSGGPLFSSDGVVIGVNTLGMPDGQNLNFAVAVDHVKKFIKANPDVKNVNPITSIVKKEYPNAITQDFDENGVIDTWYIDTNKNGKADSGYVDENEDGIIDGMLYDENEIKILVIDQVLDWANEITNLIAPSIRAAMREKDFEKSKKLRLSFIKNDLLVWFSYLQTLLQKSSINGQFFTDKFSIADITAWRVIYWFTSGHLDMVDKTFIDKLPDLKKFYAKINNYQPLTKLPEFKAITKN